MSILLRYLWCIWPANPRHIHSSSASQEKFFWSNYQSWESNKSPFKFGQRYKYFLGVICWNIPGDTKVVLTHSARSYGAAQKFDQSTWISIRLYSGESWATLERILQQNRPASLDGETLTSSLIPGSLAWTYFEGPVQACHGAEV